MLVVFVGVLFATVQMFGIVPKGFIPDTDNDSLNVQLQAAQGTSYYEMVGYTQRVADTGQAEPLCRRDDGQHRRRRWWRRNTARFNIQLTPRATRPLTAQQIAQQLGGRWGASRDSARSSTCRRPSRSAASGATAAINLNVQSLNNDELYTWAPRLEQAIAALPEVQDVSDNMELKSPRVNMIIDRDKAAAVGLNATQIENAVRRLRPEAGGDDLRRANASTACCWSSIRSIRSGPTR